MIDQRRQPHSPEHRAAISLGLRRSAWSQRQGDLARSGLPHDAVPRLTRLVLRRGVAEVGDCHWCVFWGTDGGHTGRTFESYDPACVGDPSHQHHSHDD